MTRLRPRRFSGCLLALTLSLGGTVACGGHGLVAPNTAAGARPVNPLAVTDATFAAETVTLLSSKADTPDRPGRLIGVVRYQLDRAARLFAAGHEEAGSEAVLGALYLVRAGEFHRAMLDGRTSPLLATANAVAREGSEGRALALYSMLKEVLPPGPEANEVAEHLSALSQWMEKTRSRGAIQAAGGDERTATERALWQPSHETLRAARTAVIAWIDRVIAYTKEQKSPRDDFEREEAIEAYRAIRTGAMSLAGLYLRSGTAAEALESIEGQSVSNVASPQLHDALARAADDDDPEAWLELFAQFDRSSASTSDFALDAELAQAAAWGAATELYRVEPNTMRGVMPLSTLLLRHGMAEVAPLMLRPVVAKAEKPELPSWCLGYVLQALGSHDAVGDLDAARRTFENARPILDAVEKLPFAKDVTPSVARVKYAMGALEARAGDLSRALPLVEAAVKTEPSLSALGLLAAIERQRGNTKRSLDWLDRVAKLATEASDATAVAEANIQTFFLLRDQGQAEEAAKALQVALRRALDARMLARTGVEQSSAERVLARVLEQYGNLDGAQRATVRAYDAARNDLRQLTATVLEAARRGLTHGDLRASRTALLRGIEANVDPQDLVYVALWLRLLEKKMKVPSDGTVEEALAKIDDDDGWPARLRSWSLGRLTDEQLLAASRSRSEQTEASFYAAMAAYGAGDTHASEKLAHVAGSESIDLVEVAIARDLLAQKKPLALKPPVDIDIP